MEPSRKTRKNTILAAIAAVTAPWWCLAQDDVEKPLQLDDVVVTATRTETGRHLIGSSVSVITAADMDIANVDTVGEALRLLPGIYVTQIGGRGQDTNVFIRGHNSAHTKILLNGVRLNSSTTGTYDFSSLRTDSIERIEVVSGPQSALYGSDAIGGVINIITKKGEPGLHGSVESAVGNNGYRDGALSLSGGTEVLDFISSVSLERFKGVSALYDDTTEFTEDDKWATRTFFSNVGANFLEDGRADLSLRHTKSTTDLDSFNWTTPEDNTYFTKDFEGTYANIKVQKPVTQWVTPSISYGVARERTIFDDPSNAANELDLTTKNTDAAFQADIFPIDNDTLTIGYDFERQEGFSEGNFDESVDLSGVFVQNQWTWNDQLSLTAGVRRDHHSTFGSETTYRLAASYRLPQTGTRFHATYGTGFKAPNLNDLYWPQDAWGNSGNADLKPETSKSYDLGVEQKLWSDKITLDLTYFNSDVDKLIQWALTDTGAYTPSNVDQAKIHGVETTFELQLLENLKLQASYTYTYAKDANTHAELVRRPSEKYGLKVVYSPISDLDLALSILKAGSSYEDSQNTDEIEGYTRVDLAASYEVNKNLEVFARVENLLDEEYEEATSYSISQRLAYVGLKLSF